MPRPKLTHLDEKGSARMVDVGAKPVTAREALAAKRCGELIPLCHPLPVESIEVDFDVPELEPDGQEPVRLHVKAIARITAKTGVEMEALTAVSVAALTIYDMCKAIDKAMVIGGIRLVSKTGGTHSP
jgi:cyclic pyranopterin monophosphate synthase